MFASGGREANVMVLPVSENFLFNGVNQCGVQVSTPHSVGFARLASEAFYPVRKVALALLDIKYLTGWGYIKKLTLFTRVNGICKSLLTGLTVPSDFRLFTTSSSFTAKKIIICLKKSDSFSIK